MRKDTKSNTVAPKKFKGKRIFLSTQHPGIKKVMVWDADSSSYVGPSDGKDYIARKRVEVDGKKKTVARMFATLQECFDYRSVVVERDREVKVLSFGPTIGEIISSFMKSTAWDRLCYSTQIMYEGLFIRWFDSIEKVPVRKFNAGAVSGWIKSMKKNVDKFGNANQRKSFRKEVDLLKTLLTYYEDFYEDELFESPIRKRHEEEYWVDQDAYVTAHEDFESQVSDEIPLTEDEFEKFRRELLNAKFGHTLALIADLQYDYSLRISEVAALKWRDIRPRSSDWSEGEVKWQRHIMYTHRARKKYPDILAPGLKNKKSVKRSGKRFNRRQSLSKDLPFFDSIRALKSMYLRASPDEIQDRSVESLTGLVFKNPETGSFFTYRCLKDKYDRAFRRAGLDYTGTHIVRYGGVNSFIDKYGHDKEAAMELLGNTSEDGYILSKPKKVHQMVSKGQQG